MQGKDTDSLLDLLQVILETCIEKAPRDLTYDSTMQVPYAFSMYSIVVELTRDSHQALKSRKELSSHVITRALLEAVVLLRNVIADPNHVNVRFQNALIKGRKPLKYQLDNPDLIDTANHSIEDVKRLFQKHSELRDPEIRHSHILDDFKNADMEQYYYSRYACLCGYSHHDASAIMNRPISLEVSPLDEKSTQRLADWVADLILKASISIHEFLITGQVTVFTELQRRWGEMVCELRPE